MLDVILVVKECATITWSACSIQHGRRCYMSAVWVLQVQCHAAWPKAEVTFVDKCHHRGVFGQADLVSSLQARLDIIMAEAEEVVGSSEAGDARHAILQYTSESSTYITLCLPTRVFFPVQVLDPFCSMQHDARWLEIVTDTSPLLLVGL